MNAWNKKTFSPQEKVVARAQFEALGLSNDEIANLQDPVMEGNMHLFGQYVINGQQPDAIVFDTVRQKHKAVRYHPIDSIDADAYFLKTMQGIKIYNHGSLKDGNNDPLMILIGDKDAVKKQTQMSTTLKFIPNITVLESTPALVQEELPVQEKKSPTTSKTSNTKKKPTKSTPAKKSS